MNKQRRKELEKIIHRLYDIGDVIESIKDDLDSLKEEEEDAFYNLPNGIQASYIGDDMQESITDLEEAVSGLSESYFESVIDLIAEAIDK